MQNDNLEKFLLYIAKLSKPERFLPFPDRYRLSPVPSNINLPKELIKFQTKEEWENLNKVLSNLTLEPKNDEEKYLLDYILDIPIKLSYHGKNISPHILEYEFRHDLDKERITDLKYKNRWYLFHGSPIHNWYSIIRNGIRNLSNTTLMTTGAAFGSGVYASNNLQVALCYSGHKYHCIAVIELIEDPQKYSQKGNPNIYVIPNAENITIRYLYIITDNTTITDSATQVLEYYKENKDKLLSENKTIAMRRITRDFGLESNTIDVMHQDHPKHHVMISHVLFTFYMDGYPFVKPIIQLTYKLKKKDNSVYDLDKKFDANGIYKITDWSAARNLSSIIHDIKEIITNYELTEDEYPTLV